MGERGELPLASPSPVPGHLFKIGVTSINSNTARRRDESSDDFRKLLHGVFEDAGVLRVGGGCKEASFLLQAASLSHTSALLNILLAASSCSYTALRKRLMRTQYNMQ